jgi:hypothetical protein
VPAPFQQGFALVHELLPDPDCQHRRPAALPGHRRGSFLHGSWGRRSFPRRGVGSAALPHLRNLGRRAAPAERAGSAVAQGFRLSRIKDARLVGARARPADAVLRRSDESSACRTARPHGQRAHRSLTALPKHKGIGALLVYEYTPFFCNGPSDVKSAPSDRRVAELTLLSVVDAEAATLCCQRER